MEKTIKAKFNKGVLELLEGVELKEGEEIFITIKALPTEDRFKEAAGAWKDTIDCEQLLKDIYKSRKIRRPEVKL